MSITKEQFIIERFPEVEVGAEPVGNKILLQLQTIKEKTKGGIVLVEDTKEFNNNNTRIAILRKVGQIAFKNRESGQEWKEGAWAKPGDVVVIPAHGGFRFAVDIPGTSDKAVFVTLNDYTIEMVINSGFEAFDKVL